MIGAHGRLLFGGRIEAYLSLCISHNRSWITMEASIGQQPPSSDACFQCPLCKPSIGTVFHEGGWGADLPPHAAPTHGQAPCPSESQDDSTVAWSRCWLAYSTRFSRHTDGQAVRQLICLLQPCVMCVCALK